MIVGCKELMATLWFQTDDSIKASAQPVFRNGR